MTNMTSERNSAPATAEQQSPLTNMSAWLMEQAGLTPPDAELPAELSPMGSFLVGRILISITETYAGATSRGARDIHEVVGSVLTEGVDAARTRNPGTNERWLENKVDKFGAMIRSAGRRLGGPDNLRRMVVHELAGTQGIDMADLFVPAPGQPAVVESVAADEPAAAAKRRRRDAGAQPGTPGVPRQRTRPAAKTLGAEEAREEDGGEVAEDVDEAQVQEAVDELLAEIERNTTDTVVDTESIEDSEDSDTTKVYVPDAVHSYLKQIGRRPLLKVEQEVELAKRIEAGKYAEKVIEVAALMRSGEISAAERQELVVDTYFGMNKHGRKKDTVVSVAVEDMDAARLEKAGERVDELLAHVRNRLHLQSEHGFALNTQEAMELKLMARDGKLAMDTMVESNLRLVVYFAKGYSTDYMQQLDLIQEGNLGLIHAVEMFDYTRGSKFSTYAAWWIKQAIQRGLQDGERSIRIPVHVQSQLNRLGRIENDLHTKFGREATRAEIALELEVDEDKVDELWRIRRRTLSLDEPLGDSDGDRTRHDVEADRRDQTANDDDSMDLSFIEGLGELLPRVLPDKYIPIAEMLFGLNGTPQRNISAITEITGLTRVTVRNAKTKILQMLLHPSSPARPFILEAIGVDDDELSRTHTPCKDEPTEKYFPTAKDVLAARSCGSCALQKTCKTEGIELGKLVGTKRQHQVGVWGGATASQRVSIANKPASESDDIAELSPFLQVLASAA